MINNCIFKWKDNTFNKGTELSVIFFETLFVKNIN